MRGVRLRFRSDVELLVGLHVFGQADVEATPVGGNEVVVSGDLARLGGDARAELVKLAGPIEFEAAATSVPPEAATGTQDDDLAVVTWVGEQPPRSGTGATRDAWAAFADANKVTYPSDASRDDIIRAVEAQA